MKKFFLIFAIFLSSSSVWSFSAENSPKHFPIDVQEYQKEEAGKNFSLKEILAHRVHVCPFNAVATTLFLGAIFHTFLAPKFQKLGQKIADDKEWKHPSLQTFLATICDLLGEVEVVFGAWAIPLLLSIWWFYDLKTLQNYIGHCVSFAEPVFVVAIMTIASTRPIVRFAESVLNIIAKLGHHTVSAWWITILIVAPFLGSFITEPASMTIGAMLLAKHFYHFRPSKPLSYATIGLLFVNVSVGGTLSHFAAPPILMVADKWGLTFHRVLSMLGEHAIVGVVLSTIIYYFCFRKEFARLDGIQREMHATANTSSSQEDANIPWPITLTHVLFLTWMVLNIHTPAMVIGSLLIFLAFAKATRAYQDEIQLRPAVLVGFFLAGLVIHGGLQSWWIAPILGQLRALPLFIGATILTSFNDNAAITYLSSLVTEFSNNHALQKAVLSGAVTGGGLTVIANAPNPAGQSILSKFFKDHKISPIGLFFSALLPTIIIALCFNLW